MPDHHRERQALEDAWRKDRRQAYALLREAERRLTAARRAYDLSPEGVKRATAGAALTRAEFALGAMAAEAAACETYAVWRQNQ